ncbi:plasmid partitioning protein RepB [Pseudotabrizicola alkalilacus]|uniref:Plasmid partitioning protein RepB n=1 Tax=Pseudotabrizicola alkalilacus TaxID=2305252 RepID=A0A411YXB5_9RHOB|nr:plasmid partitioning protein RepB [Pseudotabrizicola alkalilacus]RGP35428.1 plasmid partitioning protein RepB [Pseudotabrizicola alkalilacus]
MARRNIFQPPPPPEDPAAEASAPGNKPRFPNTGAMSGVKSTLRDLSSNAVREIDPSLIDDDGPKDRLTITDADVADLVQSIRAYGQQVPIMVRPLLESPGRYRIVYGRRRLRALKLAGMPAKALIRTLTDEQAILAQGQENSLRLDPSFIEKAIFVTDLADSGYDQAVVLDALAIDRPMLSRMTKVARALPLNVVHFIGAAHGIGRRRWEDLADQVRAKEIDLDALVASLDETSRTLPSDDRFALISAFALKSEQPDAPQTRHPPALSIVCNGSRVAEIKETPRSLTIRFAGSDQPEFTKWMREHAEAEVLRLYEAWRTATEAD